MVCESSRYEIEHTAILIIKTSHMVTGGLGRSLVSLHLGAELEYQQKIIRFQNQSQTIPPMATHFESVL